MDTKPRQSHAGQAAHDREVQLNQALANQPTIKIADFEGPLDLLLHLIRSSEMDIYDIQISAITGQYLSFLHQMKTMKLDVAGEYLVMAATLMTIKSRMLLPRPEPVTDEEEDAVDPREELVAQLLEYRRYQQAAGELRDKEQDRKQQFTRAAMTVPDDVQLATLAPGLTTGDLQKALANMLKHRLKSVPVSRTVNTETFSIREQMHVVLSQLSQVPCDFESLFSKQPSTDEVVTTFLALLELAKLNAVVFSQAAVDEPIMVQAGPKTEADLAQDELAELDEMSDVNDSDD
ncbi:segregation and condensation protein A [Furfurilactobacillus siliginis]|nr:segregation/condensation protein A [Furfurilactobacillus siliginis]KRN97027.1 condensin subunit ScpA [Furfurilactobacillus siliginis]